MLSHPYAPFLIEVEKPGRYIGGEFGAVAPGADCELRMALSYPDVYEIGMSHIGLGVLYELVNGLPHVSCERVFMPWPDMETKLRENGVPLVTLESARPLAELDLIGFSLQYELTFTNLITMLDLGGIPRRAAARRDDAPIVIAGGPVAAHCEPLAPFLDLVVVGDGEAALPELLERMRHGKRAGLSRQAIVASVAELPFAFAPNALERRRHAVTGRTVVVSHEPVARWARVDTLGDHPPGGTIVPNVEAVFDRFSVEVARGCAGGCRFCQAGFLYRPVRERNSGEIESAVARAVTCAGHDGVSLASLSTADHSEVGPMLRALGEAYTDKRVSFFVPSLRAYGLDAEVVEVLSRLRATGVTLAPEAGSERLRNVINKNITEGDLLAAAARFFDWGLSRIKLYFMIGLPGETDADLDAIIALAERVRQFGRQRLRGRTPTVTISVSTFVPKPFTPFAREAMIDASEIDRRQKHLVALGKKARLGVRTHAASLSLLEGILCRGDATLADALERAVDGGARFDGWSEHYKQTVWDAALADGDLDGGLAAMPDDVPTPWDHIAAGVDAGFLRAERDAAREGRSTAPCGRFTTDDESDDRFVCHHCGLKCPRKQVPLRRQRPVSDIDQLPPPPPRPKGKPRPRGAGDPVTPSVRVLFHLAKWGRQTYIGHLDTMRQVMRSFRRAGLDLFYTQGFNPKPKLVSGPPLPVGMAALRDPLEVRLIDPPPSEQLLERLSRTVPPDMAFVSVEILPDTARSLSKRIASADYLAFVPVQTDAAAKGLEAILARDSIEVTRSRKGRVKTVDIRPYLIDAAVSEVVEETLHFPPPPDRVPIRFSLYIPGSGGAKPLEIIAAAWGEDVARRTWVIRTAIQLDT